jgi:spore germination protein KC
MKSKFAMLLILIIILITVTGCWNRRELSDLAIASALGFDKSGDQYLVSVQIINPGAIAAKGGGSTELPVSTYQVTGDTVFETFRKLTTEVPRKIYLSHVRMVVIGEELAKEKGISKVLDFLSRDHELRTDFFIIVAKETKAEKVLDILTPLEKIPASKMFQSLEMSEKAWGEIGSIKLDELIADLVAEGKHPVITGIRIKGDQKTGETGENLESVEAPALLKYSGMAVFKKDKLAGWLNESESKGYNYTQGKVSSTIVVVPCPKGGKLGVELIRTTEHIKGKVENGKPKIDVEIRVEGNVGDVECDIDLSKNQSIYELETRTEQDIQSKIDAAINKSQKKLKADMFGFGEAIHRSDPKAWKEIKKNWDKEFADLSVDVKVEVKIRRTGTVGESFLKELKE